MGDSTRPELWTFVIVGHVGLAPAALPIAPPAVELLAVTLPVAVLLVIVAAEAVVPTSPPRVYRPVTTTLDNNPVALPDVLPMTPPPTPPLELTVPDTSTVVTVEPAKA